MNLKNYQEITKFNEVSTLQEQNKILKGGLQKKAIETRAMLKLIILLCLIAIFGLPGIGLYYSIRLIISDHIYGEYIKEKLMSFL